MSSAMSEETQKKNTDCVYFLASPLTCKKGNDCEFRHSESARNNPRDCWYWLSGSCLNANCAFRHPPLEAIPEGELALGGRSRVPCYYFMQGYCAKGDKCIFMHGLPAISGTELSLKGLKPNVPKTEVPEIQTSANKGNGSATSKPSSELYEAQSEAPPQRLNQVAKDPDVHASSRLPEGSGSTAPARCRPPESASIDRLKHVSAVNGHMNQVHSSDDKFQEAQTEEEPLCNFQAGDDGLGQQDPAGEEQIQEGTESEEMWEESSFDVLVDDGGTDQLIYADDLDYLNQYDLVDKLTRAADGFVEFDYEHAGAYAQYYDAEYELATYDAYEQQLVYEQLGSFDPEDGMQPVLAFKNRHGKDMLPWERGDLPFDRDVTADIGSNDLRNHIVKRRRAEKNHKHGEDHNRRRHQGNGSQHSRRHKDGHFRQQDGQGRRRLSPQLGPRSNRQCTGRGESFGGRQCHGRLVEPFRTKRLFRDMTSDHEETGAERASAKKCRGTNDGFKSKGRKELGRPAVVGVDEALGNRGHQQRRKVDARQEDSSSFAGPKSLAQIKAEKVKSLGGGFTQQPEVVTDLNGNMDESANYHGSQVRRKMSKHLPRELTSIEVSKPSKPAISMESDFEGPKPLSVILSQKRRGEIQVDARDQRLERLEDARAGSKPCSHYFSATDLTTAAGSSSLEALKAHGNKSNITDSVNHGLRGSREEGSLLKPTVSLVTSIKGQQLADIYPNRLESEFDPAVDAEDGADLGDGVIGDVDFEDEDDDFAKKLGGFLS